MNRVSRHNKGFKYEYELTPMRRFTDWLDNAVSYAIVISIVAILAMTMINLA